MWAHNCNFGQNAMWSFIVDTVTAWYSQWLSTAGNNADEW